MPTGKCCYHHPHHKNLFTAHGDQHRKDNRTQGRDEQTMGSLGQQILLHHSSCVYGSGNSVQEGGETVRGQTPGSLSLLLEKAAWTRAEQSQYQWICECEVGKSWGGGSPLNTDQQALMTAERIVSLFQEWATFLVVQCKVVSRKSYIHKQQKQTQ